MRTVFPLLLLTSILCGPAQASTLRVVDDAGREMQFAAPVGRVISLSPHLTELLFAVGAGDRIAATVRGSDYPPAAADLPQIGDATGLDFERILALRPDVVLAWSSGNRSVDVARLRELGVPVLELEPRNLEDIPRHLRLLGRLADRDGQGEAIATDFERRIAALRARYEGRPNVSVLFEIWHQPLFTVNHDHIISRVLELCGGRNIFDSLPRLAQEVSIEQVLALNPDVIVVGSEATDAGPGNWAVFPWMRAVQSGNVFAVSADVITRQTPRLADAAESLCAGLDRARR